MERQGLSGVVGQDLRLIVFYLEFPLASCLSNRQNNAG